ncbi:hypothetical protein E2C01_003025 [Portunus trituberculatus]|uniref:Uncharacterized protein n=1 Tax=Portunus trituberculatus TaxID=210409 RepID=A0A5B7CL24_PORTR|nr:hypothetical protein [Portunus trituberculatus]
MGSAIVLTGTVSDELCSISPELLLLFPPIFAASEDSSGGPATEATPGWYKCIGGLSSVFGVTLVQKEKFKNQAHVTLRYPETKENDNIADLAASGTNTHLQQEGHGLSSSWQLPL